MRRTSAPAFLQTQITSERMTLALCAIDDDCFAVTQRLRMDGWSWGMMIAILGELRYGLTV